MYKIVLDQLIKIRKEKREERREKGERAPLTCSDDSGSH